MTNKITTKAYQSSDIKALAEIYHYTIHNINTRDYSQEQVNAWAPYSSVENLESWQKKWLNLPPTVPVSGNTIIGFGEFELNSHIDCFYVHHDFQGKGVGSALMAKIEANAITNKLHRIYNEVSITAKPFFERKGFQVIKQQTVNIRECDLTNFVMQKSI